MMYGSAEKRVLLLVSSLSSFLVPYTVSSLNVALPVIGSALSLDAVTLGWINTAYLLTTSVSIIPLGKVADIYGRKRIFILGNIIFAIASLVAAFSSSGNLLISARAVQGIGGAMIFATSVAIVTEVFMPGERGKAIGIITATVYAGLSVGPVIGGILTEHLGWPSIFLINVPVALVVIFLTVTSLKQEWKYINTLGIDPVGILLYILMLGGCMYGLASLPSVRGFISLTAGLFFILIFINWEKRQFEPLLNISVFSENHVFLFSNIAAMINYATVFAVGFLVSLSLQFNRGINPALTGIILLSQPLVQTIVSPMSGHFSDSIEPRKIATIGMVFSTFGLVILLLTLSGRPLPFVICGLLVLGLGYGLFSSPNTNAIMSSVSRKNLGMASGMVSTMRAIGQLMSLAIAMIVFSLIIGTVQITPSVYGQLEKSISISIVIFILLGLVGVYTSYSRGNLAPSPLE